RLVPTVLIEDESKALTIESAYWLLDHQPTDRAKLVPALRMDEQLEDAVEERLFMDQAEASRHEQQQFESKLEQIERYIEDQLLVVRRRLHSATLALRAAEDRRDAALGSEARSQAEERVRKIQQEIDELSRESERLQSRNDPEYERWREYAHERRYREPE